MTTDTNPATELIPTEHPALVAYLRARPSREWPRLVDVLTAQLRTAGHTDPLAAAVDMLERAGEAIEDAFPGPVPTEPAALAAYLATVAPADRYLVAERLADQLGPTAADEQRAYTMVADAIDTADQIPLVPEDFSGLLDLARKLPVDRRHLLADRLAAQMGGDPRDIEHAANVVAEVLGVIEDETTGARIAAQLAERLTAANTAVLDLDRVLHRITAGADYHADYAETTGGADMCHAVNEAARWLRIAIAVNPCPPATPGRAG
ncbi:hypothetical protein [Micromonospora sp. RP3T]|uniref:hypothetical protein n=1 Tax=Micromonospora sp. RP3T TaxID=2135446 RepID=UPI003D747F34